MTGSRTPATSPAPSSAQVLKVSLAFCMKDFVAALDLFESMTASNWTAEFRDAFVPHLQSGRLMSVTVGPAAEDGSSLTLKLGPSFPFLNLLACCKRGEFTAAAVVRCLGSTAPTTSPDDDDFLRLARAM